MAAGLGVPLKGPRCKPASSHGFQKTKKSDTKDEDLKFYSESAFNFDILRTRGAIMSAPAPASAI
jgi:hypothetical protein